MNVAIIGGGIAGLSCALKLQNKGLSPVIFEKQGSYGNALEYSSILPNQIVPGIHNSLEYVNQITGFNISPFSTINKIKFIKSAKSIHIDSNFGYILKRGRSKDSIENQLVSKLIKKPILDSYIKIDDIRGHFDKIVVATGDETISKELGNWNENFTSQVRVGTVLGNFSTTSIKVWQMPLYSKHVMCYLVPNSSLEASLIMFTFGVNHNDLYYYWDKFIDKKSLLYNIIEVRDLEKNSGFVTVNNIENFHFVGNSSAFTNDFIGEGTLHAILSGTFVADDILENRNPITSQNAMNKIFMNLYEYKNNINSDYLYFFNSLRSLFGIQADNWFKNKRYTLNHIKLPILKLIK